MAEAVKARREARRGDQEEHLEENASCEEDPTEHKVPTEHNGESLKTDW